MTNYVALLRAVNVGGRKLTMVDLKQVASKLKLENPQTYIASGNLLFTSTKSEAAVKRDLETALSRHMGKPVEVMVRTAKEVVGVVAANPFETEPGNRVVAMFFDETITKASIESVKNVTDERLAPGAREIYVHFPTGQADSKLAFSPQLRGTGRNMNTVAQLAELAREMK